MKSSLAQKITELEEKIDEYEVDLTNAFTQKEKDRLSSLIICRAETLNKLYDENRSETSGELSAVNVVIFHRSILTTFINSNNL